MKNVFVCLFLLLGLGVCKASALAPAAQNNIGFGLDGLWYDSTPDQNGLTLNGQGYDVKYIKRANGSEELIIYWYIYDTAGTKQVWLIAGGVLNGTTANLVIDRVTGGKFNIRTSNMSLTHVGTMTITLIDCNSAQMSWVFNQSFDGIAGSGSQTLTRISPIISINGFDTCSTPLDDLGGASAEYNQLLADYNSLYSSYTDLYNSCSDNDAVYTDLLGTACAEVEHAQSAAPYYNMDYGDYYNLADRLSYLRSIVCDYQKSAKLKKIKSPIKR